MDINLYHVFLVLRSPDSISKPLPRSELLADVFGDV